MARIRTIKPEFWTDGDLLTVSRDARLFYIGLWNFSDDNGVMEYNPLAIKARIFPADVIRIEPLAQELAKIGKIVLYDVEGRKYLYCKNLTTHQVIDRPRKSNLPLPRKDQVISTDFSPGLEGIGRDWKGREWKGRTVSPDGKMPSEPAPVPEQLAKAMPSLKRVRLENPGDLFRSWSQAYPDVDIVGEILKADAWGVSKSVTRSAKGWARTLNTWLSKEQDRRKGGQNGTARELGQAEHKPGKYSHLAD